MENQKDGYERQKKLAREHYHSVGQVFCRELREPVYFDDAGWRHLLYRGKGRRPIGDQLRRFRLLRYAPRILSASVVSSQRKIESKEVHYFWSFTERREGREITVVIRQVNQGRKHFFSIMDGQT